MALSGKLTKKLVENLGPGRHGDGNGLYLVVDTSGEGYRCSWQTGNGPLAEQPNGEFTSAFPTTRTGDAPLPARAKSAAIRRRPRLNLQPVQFGKKPSLTTQF